jgi:hypothetical protein
MAPADDPFTMAAQNLAHRIAEQETTRSSKRYRDAQLHLSRLVQDFAAMLRIATFAFTRYPHSSEWLLQSSANDLLESVVSLPTLTSEGILNVARRELRYALEASVKYVYVDQQLPGDAPLAERVRFLGDEVPRSTIAAVDQLNLWMLGEPDALRNASKQSFGALSGHVHPSRRSVEERLKRAARGEFSGLEGPQTLEAFNRLASQTLDIVVALVMQGIGPTFTSDLFEQVLDRVPDWKFHRTRFTGEIARHFD